jgi:ABC-type transport system involved in cytochrome c biogenesis permease component
MAPEKFTSIYSVGISPARFMDPDQTSPVVMALASRIDPFVIWITVLLAIGLHVVGKIPKQQAYISAAIVWVVGALPAVFGALRS